MYNNYNMLFTINESSKYRGGGDGNVEAFLSLGNISIYDENLKSIIEVPAEDFVNAVNGAMMIINTDYKFFSTYLKYSKVFYIPNYPSKMGINTMAVDEKKNLWMNVHFIYNNCKMNKERIFGILFHELMHNCLNHQEREEQVYPIKSRTPQHHTKANICQDYEVNASMVADGIVDASYWKRMGGLYKKEYEGMRWEAINHRYGDQEYDDYLKKQGLKLDDKTKEALKEIEKALEILHDENSTEEDKKYAAEKLKDSIDELYGKRIEKKKSIDRADLDGFRKDLEKMAESNLGEIGNLESIFNEVAYDLRKHPKDMSDEEVKTTTKDILEMKKAFYNNVADIAKLYEKPEEMTKNDLVKAIDAIFEMLDEISEGVSVKKERKLIRKAKDAFADILLNKIEKERRKEERKKAIEEHKKKLEEKRREKEKSKAKAEKELEKIKKRNPIKKFVDTFKNLRDLKNYKRISLDTYEILSTIVDMLEPLVEKNISDISETDINGVVEQLTLLQPEILKDLKLLRKKRILPITDLSELKSKNNELFNDIKKFFEIICGDDERSVKFAAMSLSVGAMRELGRLLKTQRKIKMSKAYKEGYKKELEKLRKIYKEKGKDALMKELTDSK